MTSYMYPVPHDAESPGASDAKWFAGLAMQAIIQQQGVTPQTESQREEISLWAWRMGQAMVETEARIHAEVP